jgi:GNAT superfamily N-acetyltransferase
LEIRPVSYAEILAQTELLNAYAEECSIPEIGVPDPQAEIYEQMQKLGMLQVFGAFDPDLIGFASLLLTVLPHYGKKVATVESLFVLPEYRTIGVGSELLAMIERFAKDEGCTAILYSAPAGGKLAKLLELKDYRRTNEVFCRPL